VPPPEDATLQALREESERRGVSVVEMFGIVLGEMLTEAVHAWAARRGGG
jgi:hypothetical protein